MVMPDKGFGPGAWPAPASRDARSRSPHWAAMRSARAQIPIRAMFVGAAGVSARRRRRSGTGTRVIAFAGFTASWGCWVSVR